LRHQGSTVLHHSNSEAELKYQSENGLLSFSEVFFWFFFGQAKKNKEDEQREKLIAYSNLPL
jgi:hypothetical protein